MGNSLQRVFKGHLPSIRSFPPTAHTALIEKVLTGPPLILRQIDEQLTCVVGGPSPAFPFPNAMAYYEYVRSDRHLEGIRVPFLALSAKDDPIVPHFPTKNAEANGWSVLALTSRGGHLGWFEDAPAGYAGGRFRRWNTTPVLEWLRATIEKFDRKDVPDIMVEVVGGFTREVERPEIGFREIDAQASLSPGT